MGLCRTNISTEKQSKSYRSIGDSSKPQGKQKRDRKGKDPTRQKQNRHPRVENSGGEKKIIDGTCSIETKGLEY